MSKSIKDNKNILPPATSNQFVFKKFRTSRYVVTERAMVSARIKKIKRYASDAAVQHCRTSLGPELGAELKNGEDTT